MKKCDLTEELVNSNKDKYPRLKHIRFDNNTKGKCLLDNNQLIGIVQVDMKRKYILALEVFEPYKRKGYGTNLLKIAVNELGAEKLSVNKNNKNAISLYNKNMWEIYDEDKNMFYMKTKDAKIYKKGVKESMTDEDIKAYLETNRPLCCGFNEIKDYLDSNIILYCSPEDTYELNECLETSNVPKCLLELFLDEEKVNDPEYIIKAAKLPTPDVIGTKIGIKIANSKHLVNMYKECDSLIVQAEAALEQYKESSIPSKVIKSILSWIALANTGKNIDSYKVLTSGSYSRKQKKMRYGASRDICLKGIKLAKIIKHLITEELKKRANNEKKKDLVARRFIKNKSDIITQESYECDIEDVVNNINRILCEQIGSDNYMYEEYDTEYFDTFLESLDCDDLIFEESFYSKKVDKRLKQNQSDSFIKKTRLKTMIQPIVIGVKRLSDDAIQEQIKTCNKQISLLEEEAEYNKNEDIRKRILKKVLKTISGDTVPVQSLDALSQAEMATQYRKITQILKSELKRRKEVKESMYEEFDTEYFNTFLESLDPELESKYSDKVDDQLAKNKDPEYIDQKKLGIITRAATEAIKKMPDKLIKAEISNLEKNIKQLETIAENNKNDGVFKRILGFLMQAYGGPVKLWRALTVAQVASESRRILKELKDELASRESKKGVKESMEENNIFDVFLEALRAESGLPTIVDPSKSASVTIQKDNTNTKLDEVQSSYAKFTNDSGIDTPKPTNMEDTVPSKQTKLDTVDGLKNPTIPDNTCKVQASAAKLESSDFEGEVDLDLVDLDIF